MTIEDIFTSFQFPLSSSQKKLLKSAYDTAKKAHGNQTRRSGEEYIVHPLAAAKILAEIGMDVTTVVAGLLHDVPEDTETTLNDIRKEFGDEVALLVDGVTKLGHIKLRGSKQEYFLENLRKMFLAMASDIRVIIIRLADRLHNMRTLEHLAPEKRQRIALETLEIYAPIANRLGIGEIKGELEDLAFKHLDPENYKIINDIIESQHKERDKFLETVIKELKESLSNAGIKIRDINGRVKHIYRLYQKMKKHDMDVTRIYDLVAVRIIVNEIADCYETLGIVHKRFRPMIGRIKDYISLPKPNGYQSLHTTIFGPSGRIFEVQIRTQKMHNEAEFGIASHWIYTEKEKKSWTRLIFGNRGVEEPKKDIKWVSQLREWQSEVGSDNDEFLKSLKLDFFKNHIFAFTPKGDIIELPEEATPIDFAYAIHSEIGSRTTGAKADGKIIPLNHHIKNGQVIEILTTKEKKRPSRDWLGFAKTSNAKSRIRRELKRDSLF